MPIDVLRDFREGVITSDRPDRLPEGASPRGRNSYLLAGPGGAIPAKRKGFSTVNTTSIASTAISNQIQYKRLSGGSYTRHHIIAGSDGRIGTLDSDPSGSGAYTSIATGVFTGDTAPDFAIARNLLFIANGTAQRKFDGTNLQTFGIAAPSTAPTLAAGAAGTPSGTYEARVTFYNATTGHESSASPTSSTVSISSQQIDFSSIPVSADSQVTARKLYLRNTSTQVNFYLAATISDNTSTTYTYNQADTLLITLGPDTASNNPPPSDTKYLAWHRSRMFALTDTDFYYSALEKPEAFDESNFEPVDPENSQKNTGAISFNGILVIFKERSMYGLYGVNPSSWSIELLSPDIGCTSHRSIVAMDGTLYWWSHLGPVMWSGEGPPKQLGQIFLRSTLANDSLAHGEYPEVVAEVLEPAECILFSVSDYGESRNTRILPFNYRLGRFTSDGWNGIEAASLKVIEDDTGRRWTYFGNYNGQVFRLWDTDTDGVPSGTVTGTFTAGASSISFITSSGFYTIGSGLAERYVTLEDANGDFVSSVRISSNTATTLTLSANITGLSAGSTYTFHVGGPNFEWDTRTEEGSYPFVRKKYQNIFIQTEDTAATVNVALYRDNLDAIVRRHSYSTSSSTQSLVTKRFSASFTGVSWKARISNRAANAPLVLSELSMSFLPLNDKVNA